MNSRTLAFVYSQELERFSYPPDCPFRPERAGRTRNRIASLGLLEGPDRTEKPPRAARRAELEMFHTPRYLEQMQRAAAGHLTVDGFLMGLGTPDCPVFKDMYEYGRWGCGATITAAELILAGEADIVFNPSGGFHHAKAAMAAGFCYLNDAVLGCMCLAEHGKRVLFLDIDAHHGDGVQEAFYARKDVMTISLHESGKTLFPGTGFENEIGEGEGRGYSVNVPLPAGTYDEAYLHACRKIVWPLLGAYDPEVIVLELGMDTLAGDPLTHLSLTNNACVEIIRSLLSFDKPILATGGGGYHVDNTVRGWALAWKTFCGDEEHDLSLGLGGVMLQSEEWLGGLRDRELAVSDQQRRNVDAALQVTIDAVVRNVFPYHQVRAEELS